MIVPMRGAIVLLLALVTLASGQTSPEERQAILDYPLTLQRANSLIPAMEAMTKYVVSLPDFKERVQKSAKMTPAAAGRAGRE